MLLNLDKTLRKKRKRQWPKLYWAIDLHGTIFKSTYSKEKDFKFYNNWERDFLKFLSSRIDCVLILWTSTHKDDLLEYVSFLKKSGITFDYINENPECPSTDISDFTNKFYFDILIDDKAGFIPERHWRALYNKIKWLEKELK